MKKKTVTQRGRRRVKNPALMTDFYVKGISVEVKSAFKAWCARRRKTMRRAIEDLMLEKIREDTDEDIRPIAP